MNASRRHSLAMYADSGLNDARTTCALIDDALKAIDVARAGWPTSVPGANPNTAAPPLVGVREDSTSTERAALSPDQAATDYKALTKAIHAASEQQRIAAIIARRWATPTIEGGGVRQRLAAIDATIWCVNHLKHHMHEPRRTHNDTCDTCSDFRTRYKRDAPIEVLDYQSRYGRLYETQIRRLLAKADERIKREREAKKRADLAASRDDVVA